MYEIIDSHAHIYPDKIAGKAATVIGQFYDIPMNCNGSVKVLLDLGKAAGISRFLVHSVATVPHQVKSINRFILEEMRLHPEFIGFMTLHPDLTEEEIAEEVDFGVENGFHGVKLHPDFQKFAINSDVCRKICNVVGSRLPVLFHTGDRRYTYSHPDYLAEIAKEYPHMRFIGAHFGGWSCWKEAEIAYKGLDNVFFDTSSSLAFLPPEEATRLIYSMGAEKFFFGTDYPMWLPDEEIARFLALPLTEKEREGIFSKNLLSFLNLE
ncbi:MAG: amidohydrolase family protein [Christensenellales bacterium]